MKLGKISNSAFYVMVCLTILSFMSCSSDDDNNSLSGAVAPVAQEASDIALTSFRANWNNVFRASEYALDVSTNSGFSSFVEGFDNLSINQLSQSVTGLNSNTTYYYRVRAVVGGVISGNSNTISVETNTEFPDDVTLKSATENNFFVGVAVSEARTNISSYDEIYTREFSSITAENDMKMASIFTGIDNTGAIIYDWSKVDALVDYAETNNLNVHGHTLIWHRSLPQALENFSGTDQEFEDLIEQYITAVLTRYQGRINSWDVVNEAIDDDPNIQWRDTVFLQRMGEDYVEKCFAFARAADPNVKLFYNDYNMTFDGTKRGKVLVMVDDLLVNDLIDGVGYQMHIDYNFPSREQIQEATDEIVAKDVLVHFAELDVKVNAANDLTELTEERSQAQRQRVREVVEIFNAIPQNKKYAITVWGLKDDDTWLIPENNGRPEWPLLFDASFNKKDAYQGFLEGL
ncbi:1,4-beta-xylanase [Aquimarina sp. BL5]|uniref:endo-1,4-beta-xylanase n=1 Tax=Aquimarina sp. BL5 TaxID=1714860 RepID=UPI000E4C9917|nr:endo-1,4-beta-xylanase [Aquimarina sp. BL5]AXT52104.1 1,4-beta-xylanase [Aquimarina sp. BL5]RKN05152.1 1,4-beta-xylanase [Aquimarina sp. BL5]